MKRAIISIALLTVSIFSITSQNLYSTYFLNEWSHRNKLNAAFAPEYGFLSLPVVGGFQFNISTNTGLNTYIYPYNSEFTTFLNSNVDANLFLNKLDPTNYINQGMDLSIFSLGFYTSKMSFWSFDITMKQRLNIDIPKGLFEFMKLGMANQSNTFDLKNFGVNQTNTAEVSLGYSNQITKKFRFGVNAKLLVGLTSERIKYSQFDLTLADNRYEINAVGESLIMSEFVSFEKDANNNYDFTKSSFDFSKAKPAGYGAAVDLGFTYKPFKRLTISGAINDLGYMKWNSSSIKRGVATSNVLFTGFNNVNIDSMNIDAQVNKMKDDLNNMVKFKEVASNADFQETIPYTINASAEFGIFGNDKHDILFGLLWQRYKMPNINPTDHLIGAVTLKPLSWFTLSGTCDLLSKDFNRYGIGFNFSPRWINLFIASDFVTPKLSPQFIPIEKLNLNIVIGGNFVLGRPKDSDKDGVVNRRDKCPDTPFGLLVDKKGCPFDTDGDGVPDYLDKCANTPKEAFSKVDSVGCPLDSDGDGVFDYLDICSETPTGVKVDSVGCSLDSDKDGVYDNIDKCLETPAGIDVDSVGCPKDSDGDSVADYLDLCPGTPSEAFGKVDKNGCPLDTDGDGVYDYLDLCANTPIDGRGFVNKDGCPIDTDGDSIPNYLDKCPNTPKEAIGYVDSIGCSLDSDKDGIYNYLDKCANTPAGVKVDLVGCPLDTDGDSIPDYLDKCPATPKEAYKLIDINGCPIDTDGDGVPDYLDNCPSTVGVSTNNGCPEIKKEVKTLFQKALQGVQFEPGKAVIKKTSFVILNQIAKVLIDNSTYLIEVRGHTDNVGLPASNLIISEKRAAAVRDYLVQKGVSENRITSKGFGDTKPVANNKTTAGKAKNRRVEFVVTF